MKHYRDRQVYAQIDALTEIGLHIEMATAGAEVAATEPEAAEAEPVAAEE
jgi:hypothetical protein